MKAIFLIRKGDPFTSFETREIPVPKPGAGEILIRVEGFGLNFADVLARRGLYPDAPPMPCVLGYDVVGVVTETSDDATNFKPGDRVTSMTHFGGYAEYAVAPSLLSAKIPDSMPAGEATALTVQYCTAYYAAAETVNLYPGDKVLIHAAAGGVGTALLQYCKYKGCEIFATAGSQAKLDMLQAAGADHVINYTTEDFSKRILEITGKKGVQVIFDSVGGITTKKGFRLLTPGGNLIIYGAASFSGTNIFGKIKNLIGFGFYHPLKIMGSSKTITGINMLKIALNKPAAFKRCLDNVVKLYEEGVFKPVAGGLFPASEIGKAHDLLESRRTTGKITVFWK
ncbi:MAG TPA: zinc-binding dehydrogenase [Puia sp.]|nr:zinc-binding dehydrogenase [Puia sp.]